MFGRASPDVAGRPTFHKRLNALPPFGRRIRSSKDGSLLKCARRGLWSVHACIPRDTRISARGLRRRRSVGHCSRSHCIGVDLVFSTSAVVRARSSARAFSNRQFGPSSQLCQRPHRGLHRLCGRLDAALASMVVIAILARIARLSACPRALSQLVLCRPQPRR